MYQYLKEKIQYVFLKKQLSSSSQPQVKMINYRLKVPLKEYVLL